MDVILYLSVWSLISLEIVWQFAFLVYSARYRREDDSFYDEDKKHLQFVYLCGTFVIVPLMVILAPAVLVLLMILNNERIPIWGLLTQNTNSQGEYK